VTRDTGIGEAVCGSGTNAWTGKASLGGVAVTSSTGYRRRGTKLNCPHRGTFGGRRRPWDQTCSRAKQPYYWRRTVQGRGPGGKCKNVPRSISTRSSINSAFSSILNFSPAVGARPTGSSKPYTSNSGAPAVVVCSRVGYMGGGCARAEGGGGREHACVKRGWNQASLVRVRPTHQ
jgi:hypothetical protein